MDKQLLENVFNNLTQTNEFQIETGYLELDNFLQYCGKGSLITVGGVPAMGKSVFCKNIIINQLISGKKCMYFDLEWTKEQLVRSLLFLHSGISLSRRNSLSDDDINKLKTTTSKMAYWELKIEDSSCFGIENILKRIEEYKPDYVFIDPLNEIRNENNLCDIKTILEKLQKCARKTGAVIFATSTLNNSVEFNEYKIPTWKDFKDSEAVIEYSDQILLLYRPDYYYGENEIPEGHQPKTIEVISNKYIKGSLSLEFDCQKCQIKGTNEESGDWTKEALKPENWIGPFKTTEELFKSLEEDDENN